MPPPRQRQLQQQLRARSTKESIGQASCNISTLLSNHCRSPTPAETRFIRHIVGDVSQQRAADNAELLVSVKSVEHVKDLVSLYGLVLRNSSALADASLDEERRTLYRALRSVLCRSINSLLLQDPTRLRVTKQVFAITLVIRTQVACVHSKQLAIASEALRRRVSRRNVDSAVEALLETVDLLFSLSTWASPRSWGRRAFRQLEASKAPVFESWSDLLPELSSELIQSNICNSWASCFLQVLASDEWDDNRAAKALMQFAATASSIFCSSLRMLTYRTRLADLQPALQYLLALYVVQLAAALDGESTYGMPVDTPAIPFCNEKGQLVRRNQGGVLDPTVLLFALDLYRAWLAEETERYASGGGDDRFGDGSGSGDDSFGDDSGSGGGFGGAASDPGSSTVGSSQAEAPGRPNELGAGTCSGDRVLRDILPPFNTAATVQLSGRIAKAVLAIWRGTGSTGRSPREPQLRFEADKCGLLAMIALRVALAAIMRSVTVMVGGGGGVGGLGGGGGGGGGGSRVERRTAAHLHSFWSAYVEVVHGVLDELARLKRMAYAESAAEARATAEAASRATAGGDCSDEPEPVYGMTPGSFGWDLELKVEVQRAAALLDGQGLLADQPAARPGICAAAVLRSGTIQCAERLLRFAPAEAVVILDCPRIWPDLLRFGDAQHLASYLVTLGKMLRHTAAVRESAVAKPQIFNRATASLYAAMSHLCTMFIGRDPDAEPLDRNPREDGLQDSTATAAAVPPPAGEVQDSSTGAAAAAATPGLAGAPKPQSTSDAALAVAASAAPSVEAASGSCLDTAAAASPGLITADAAFLASSLGVGGPDCSASGQAAAGAGGSAGVGSSGGISSDAAGAGSGGRGFAASTALRSTNDAGGGDRQDHDDQFMGLSSFAVVRLLAALSIAFQSVVRITTLIDMCDYDSVSDEAGEGKDPYSVSDRAIAAKQLLFWCEAVLMAILKAEQAGPVAEVVQAPAEGEAPAAEGTDPLSAGVEEVVDSRSAAPLQQQQKKEKQVATQQQKQQWRRLLLEEADIIGLLGAIAWLRQREYSGSHDFTQELMSVLRLVGAAFPHELRATLTGSATASPATAETQSLKFADAEATTASASAGGCCAAGAGTASGRSAEAEAAETEGSSSGVVDGAAGSTCTASGRITGRQDSRFALTLEALNKALESKSPSVLDFMADMERLASPWEDPPRLGSWEGGSSQRCFSLSSHTQPQHGLFCIGCGNPGCINLSGPSELALQRVACGSGGCECRMMYCSQECRRAHWRAGHKEECSGRGLGNGD